MNPAVGQLTSVVEHKAVAAGTDDAYRNGYPHVQFWQQGDKFPPSNNRALPSTLLDREMPEQDRVEQRRGVERTIEIGVCDQIRQGALKKSRLYAWFRLKARVGGRSSICGEEAPHAVAKTASVGREIAEQLKCFRGMARLFEEFSAGSMLRRLAVFDMAAGQFERHSAHSRPKLAHEHEPAFRTQSHHADIVFGAQRVMGAPSFSNCFATISNQGVENSTRSSIVARTP